MGFYGMLPTYLFNKKTITSQQYLYAC